MTVEAILAGAKNHVSRNKGGGDSAEHFYFDRPLSDEEVALLNGSGGSDWTGYSVHVYVSRGRSRTLVSFFGGF